MTTEDLTLEDPTGVDRHSAPRTRHGIAGMRVVVLGLGILLLTALLALVVYYLVDRVSHIPEKERKRESSPTLPEFSVPKIARPAKVPLPEPEPVVTAIPEPIPLPPASVVSTIAGNCLSAEEIAAMKAAWQAERDDELAALRAALADQDKTAQAQEREQAIVERRISSNLVGSSFATDVLSSEERPTRLQRRLVAPDYEGSVAVRLRAKKLQ